MRSRALAAIGVAVLLGGLAFAQSVPNSIDLGPIDFPLPPAQVGVPYEVDFGEGLEQAFQGSGVSFTATYTLQGGAPQGLSLTSSGRLTGRPTAPGQFRFSVPARWVFSDQGFSFTVTFTYVCTLDVTGAPGGISGEGSLSFTATQGAPGTLTQSVRITNRSATPRSLSARAATVNGGNWLSVGGGGSVGAFSSTTLTATANPAGLPPGVYSGSITVSATGGPQPETLSFPAVLTVTSTQPTIQLSQTGMTFELVQGSPASLTQQFQVGNNGAGTLQYSATATTIAGGSWLRVAPASGNATAAQPANLTVTVSAAGLAAGQYHGQVEARAEASNSPQVVTVVLNVAPPTQNVAPVVVPTGLIFIQRPGAAPQPQTVTLTNVSARPVTVALANAFDNSPNDWFSSRIPSPTIAAGASATITVTRETRVRLPAGVHRGEVTLRFGTGQTRRVAIVGVVLPGAENAADTPASFRTQQADGCTPTQLVPVFTTLGSGFSITAAWPNALEMRVIDDCGDALLRGIVTVSFSSGDPPLPLTHVGEGRWTGTWQPRAGAQNVVLTADARNEGTPSLTGTAQIGGAAANNTTTPAIDAGGVLSAASYAPKAPIPPGGYIAVFGKSLANGLSVSDSYPLAFDLGGTQVVMGNRRLPLQFASDGQINAVVPYDVPINASQQVIVRRGNALSTPEQITVAAAAPAVFTKNQTGKGEGIVVAFKPATGQQILIGPEAPAVAGDVLIIYCTGLGPVTPAVTAGTASPLSPLANTVNPVTVRVGGREAPVAFAGLAPGFAALYQINAVMPEGVTAGAAVEMTLSVAGQTSPPVTIAVR